MRTLRVRRLGFNASVDAAEDVISPGSNQPYPSAAAATEIISTAIADDEGSTGAEKVFVEGLLANGVLNSETATMNGNSAVSLASNYQHILNAYVTQAGSNLINEGTIDIRHAGPTILAQIPIAYGRSMNASYVVPTTILVGGRSLNFVGGEIISVGAGIRKVAAVSGLVALETKKPGSAWTVDDIFELNQDGNSDLHRRFDITIPLVAGMFIRVRVKEVSAAATEVTADFVLEARYQQS